MNENQRQIQVISLRRRAMMIMLIVSVLTGLATWSALYFQWGLPRPLLQAGVLAMNISAFASLACMGMVVQAVRNVVWAVVVTAVALYTVTVGLYAVAIVAVIVVNRLAAVALHRLKQKEAAKLAALQEQE